MEEVKQQEHEEPTVQPFNPFCAFFLTRKRRNCKMRVKKGALYCAEHLTAAGEDHVTSESSEDKRIPCPLDPAHTVYESRLKAHLKKCNASVSEIVPPHFFKDLNILVKDTEFVESDNAVRPSISELVERIEAAAEKLKGAEIICERFNREQDISSISETEKHRIQQKALGDLILEKVQPGKYEKVVVVEFGAGKGGLSSYLWESFLLPNGIASEFLLIDRSNFRLKKDAKMRHAGAVVKRLFLDIKDLNLQPLLADYDREKTYFLLVSKHLCGTATCLTINSLKHAGIEGIKGTFCVALCCHQCCSSRTYPNMPFIREMGLIKERESTDKVFRMLCSITSWAVCGFRESRSDSDSEDESDEDFDAKRVKITTPEDETIEDTVYSVDKKAAVGRTMKRLFDYGRKLKMNADGFDVQLQHYVEEEVTLENAVLIGHLE